MKHIFLVVVLLGSTVAQGQECPPVNLYLMVDESGSIEATEMNEVVRVLQSAIDEWRDDMYHGSLWVGVGAFGDGARTVCGFTPYTPALLDSVSSLIAKISRETSLLSAVVDPAFQFGLQSEASRFAFGVNIVLVLTDGIGTMGLTEAELHQTRQSLQGNLPGRGLYFALDISKVSADDSGDFAGRGNRPGALRAIDSEGAYRDLWQPEDVTELWAIIQGTLACE